MNGFKKVGLFLKVIVCLLVQRSFKDILEGNVENKKEKQPAFHRLSHCYNRAFPSVRNITQHH